MGQKTTSEFLRQEKINSIVKREVFFWRYDKLEDVYINKWSIANNKYYGIQYRPEFESKSDAENWFRDYLVRLGY